MEIEAGTRYGCPTNISGRCVSGDYFSNRFILDQDGLLSDFSPTDDLAKPAMGPILVEKAANSIKNLPRAHFITSKIAVFGTDNALLGGYEMAFRNMTCTPL